MQKKWQGKRKRKTKALQEEVKEPERARESDVCREKAMKMFIKREKSSDEDEEEAAAKGTTTSQRLQ